MSWIVEVLVFKMIGEGPSPRKHAREGTQPRPAAARDAARESSGSATDWQVRRPDRETGAATYPARGIERKTTARRPVDDDGRIRISRGRWRGARGTSVKRRALDVEAESAMVPRSAQDRDRRPSVRVACTAQGQRPRGMSRGRRGQAHVLVESEEWPLREPLNPQRSDARGAEVLGGRTSTTWRVVADANATKR